MVTKTALYALLDDYVAGREAEVLVGTMTTTSPAGSINMYSVRALENRVNQRARIVEIRIFVWDEGGGQEKATFDGDPISDLFKNRIIDYVTFTNNWSGEVIRCIQPDAIARVIEPPATTEKYIRIHEDSPGSYTVTDVTLNEFVF